MISDSHSGWQQRIVWSCVLGTAAVVFCTLFFFFIEAGHPSKAMDAVSYVIGIPLLPGVGFVSVFWGSWQAVHQGQIALVPPVSVVVDSLIIFVIWEFAHHRRSPRADVRTTLNLNG
jgi:hypothetical protein